MTGRPDPRALVDRIERLIHVDVGRNISGLFDAARGALWGAASALAAARAARVGIDHRLLCSAGLSAGGGNRRAGGCRPARKGAEKRSVSRAGSRRTSRAAAPAQPPSREPVSRGCRSTPSPSARALAPLIEAWRAAGITHAISIERCGRSADGAPRNMRGQDIGSYTAPLDDLFVGRAVGNDCGRRRRQRDRDGRAIPLVDRPPCRARRDDRMRHPARHLIVAGVSNWGAYALIGALAALREDWRASIARLPRRDARPRGARGDRRARAGGRRRIAYCKR